MLGNISKAIAGGLATGSVGAGGAVAFVGKTIPGAEAIGPWGYLAVAAAGFLGGFAIGFATVYAFPKNTGTP